MRDSFGNVYSRATVEAGVATQRLGGGMISDDQIISVSASKITGGDVPGAGVLENALTIIEQDGSTTVFDGAVPESITLTKVDSALSATSDNAIANKAVLTELNKKANSSGQYPTLTAGKVSNKITFTGGATGEYDGGSATTITIPQPPTVPTKLSELSNDSGYMTQAQVQTAITNALASYYTKTEADDKFALKTV